MEPEVVTITEAGRRKGVRPESVWAAIKRGKLPAYRSGATWLIRVEDLERYQPVHDAAKRARIASEAARGKPRRKAGDRAQEGGDARPW